jgi:phosphoglycerate dehydrogenase-like enzyme
MTIEVLITLPFTEALANHLRSVSPNIRVSLYSAKKSEEIPPELWTKTEVLFTERILPKPDQAPNLKWVQFSYAGIDYWLDDPILARPGLLVTTMSGAGAPAIAEYALMMMLALGHKMPAMSAAQRKGEWLKDAWSRYSASELRGSTVGIIGYGSIGRQVAHLLQPFEATVLATKRNAKHPEDPGYTAPGTGDPGGNLVHRLYPAEALKSMLKLSDFILVCVPLTPETRGLLNAETLAVAKPGAYIVDVSRGGIIDHTALIKALQDGALAGAALDVFPNEPLPPNSPLWSMPNVILTPHIADTSPHYLERGTDLFGENLLRYLAGITLFNLFDPEKGY